MVGPNVYVNCYPTELDVLIVEKSSVTISGTAAYRKQDVRLLIEIKKHGFYHKKREAASKISEYFDRFREIGKPFVYLTIKESPTMMYATRAVLENDPFFLCESPHHAFPAEWQRFVELLLQQIRDPNG